MIPQLPPLPVRSASVLLVEDETIIRISLAEYLQTAGFDVHQARTGDDALQLLLSGLAVDAVFTDVQMPGVLDGLELARWVRANRPLMHVLIASGRVNLECAARELCDPRSQFIKPYGDAAIAQRLRALTH